MAMETAAQNAGSIPLTGVHTSVPIRFAAARSAHSRKALGFFLPVRVIVGRSFNGSTNLPSCTILLWYSILYRLHNGQLRPHRWCFDNGFSFPLRICAVEMRSQIIRYFYSALKVDIPGNIRLRTNLRQTKFLLPIAYCLLPSSGGIAQTFRPFRVIDNRCSTGVL